MTTDLEKFETRTLEAVSPLLAVAKELLERAQAQVVTSDEDLKLANELKKEINGHAKTVKELRMELTRPIDAIKDKILVKEKEILYPLELAKNTLAKGILDYEEELERQRLAEIQRVNDICASLTAYWNGNQYDTAEQVQDALKGLQVVYEALPEADRSLPKVGAAYSEVTNRLNYRAEAIEAEARAAAERKRQADEAERLRKEAAKQSEEEARIAAKRAEQEAEKRRLDEEAAEIERKKKRIADEKERQRLDAEALAAEKEAEKAEAARPKSNITTTIDFEVEDADQVPREFCSPDDKKIRAYLKGVKNADEASVPGVKVFEKKTVR